MCAAAVALFPLQKYISLGRFQKYGMAILIFGIGYFLQLAWSWGKLQKWARASNAATAAFFAFVGITFYQNPWLDTHVSVQTDDRITQRYLLLVAYSVFAVIIATIWFKWIEEETKNKPEGTSGDSTGGGGNE